MDGFDRLRASRLGEDASSFHGIFVAKVCLEGGYNERVFDATGISSAVFPPRTQNSSCNRWAYLGKKTAIIQRFRLRGPYLQ